MSRVLRFGVLRGTLPTLTIVTHPILPVRPVRFQTAWRMNKACMLQRLKSDFHRSSKGGGNFLFRLWSNLCWSFWVEENNGFWHIFSGLSQEVTPCSSEWETRSDPAAFAVALALSDCGGGIIAQAIGKEIIDGLAGWINRTKILLLPSLLEDVPSCYTCRHKGAERKFRRGTFRFEGNKKMCIEQSPLHTLWERRSCTLYSERVGREIQWQGTHANHSDNTYLYHSTFIHRPRRE